MTFTDCVKQFACCGVPVLIWLLLHVAIGRIQKSLPIRVYVAGASREIDRCARAMQMVSDYGHRVTHDWIEPMMRVRSQGIEEHECGFMEARRYAEADLKGIEQADVVWMQAPTTLSEGFWVELGYALRACKPIVITGPAAYCRKNIFMFAQNIDVFFSEEDAIACITARAWTKPTSWWDPWWR